MPTEQSSYQYTEFLVHEYSCSILLKNYVLMQNVLIKINNTYQSIFITMISKPIKI